MKNIKISLVLGSLLGGLTAASPALSADLLDVYKLAQQNDPQIAAAEANFLAASQAKPLARAQYLPQIDAGVSYGRSESTSSGAEFFAGQVFPNESESESTSTSWQIELRQTIFNWGTINEIQQAAAEVARAEAEYHAAQQELIIRVAEAYFNLLAAQDSLEASRVNKESIGRQLDQSKKRFEVGLIAITDVQEAQAAFDQATAEVIAAERSANSARENLRAIIGEYVEDPAAPMANMPLVSPEPASVDEWVEQALEQNLTVVANRFALESAEQTTDIRRAGHYPTLDLIARHEEGDGDFDSVDLLATPPSVVRIRPISSACRLTSPFSAAARHTPGPVRPRIRKAQRVRASSRRCVPRKARRATIISV